MPVSQAHAQDGANADAQAERLFEEGRVLMDQRRYAEACAKLAASARLAPSGGALLNLADCYEKDGKTASAWARFKEVATRAATAKRPDIEAHARSRASALEPKLSTLTVRVPDAVARIDGLVIRRAEAEVERAAWGTALPLDPGAYIVEASAPGRKKWQGKVTVGAVSDRAEIEVPMLEADGAMTSAPTMSPYVAETPPPPPATGSNPWSTQRWIGLGAATAGLVALGVGAGFGLRASSKNDDALYYCPASPQCSDPRGPALTNAAQDAATISTIGFIGGGVLLAAGIVIWLTAPSATSSALRHSSSAGLLGGTF